MEWIKEMFNQISSLFKWWIIVLPWESGLRIRLGKYRKIIPPGIFFRIPYFDSVYVQPIRLMFINTPNQTLTNKSGETITLALIIGYIITDISEVYNSVSELESAVSGRAMGEASKYIALSTKTECSAGILESIIVKEISQNKWGIKITEVSVTNFAITRTYRLIQGDNWLSQGRHLNTKS